MPQLKHRSDLRTPVIALLLISSLLCAAETPEQLAGKISINGVEEQLEENIRQHLTLSNHTCETPAWRLQAAVEGAPAEINLALQALGYYDAAITSGGLVYQDGCWNTSFDIVPGKPVRIRDVDIRFEEKAARDSHFQRLLHDLPLVKGDILNHGNYTASKNALQSAARERGYFDAELTRHLLLVDPQQYSADIQLTLTSGTRYRFGEINISSDWLDQDLLDRLVTIAPGELYSSDKVQAFQQALNDSGYFDSAVIRERQDSRRRRVDLDITLTPSKRYAIGFGVGLTTDGGPRVSSNLQNRYVNRRGHRFNSNIRYEALLGVTLDISYMIPLEHPEKEWFSLLAQVERIETDTSDHSTARAGVSMTKIRPHDWLETRYLTLKTEEYVVADEPGRAMPLIPGISWTRLRKDAQQRISRGEKLHLELRGAVYDFTEGSPFLQAIASGKWINSPWEQGRIISRLDLAATLVDDINNLAASDRLFSGGDNSIRGYGYQELGPENDSGRVVGGKYLAVASLEYEHYLKKGWSVAAFVDAGNAFNDSLDVKSGVGLGLRWLSPLGPIKVDLAHPLDDEQNAIRFVFRMGPEF
jgi:translocation and assembly module TamA